MQSVHPHSRRDGTANAHRWITLLEEAIHDKPNCKPSCECLPARAWVSYLKVLTLNAAIGASRVGLPSPMVPLATALARARGQSGTCPPNTDQAPYRP